MRQRSWEDIEVGERIPLGTVVMSREAIVAFAAEFDPQQVHLDEEAAKSTFLRAQAASGWHTCVVVHQLFESAMTERALPLAICGADDVRWRRPVRPGDALSGHAVISAKSECSCRTQAGSCRAVIEVTNQFLDIVASWHADCILPRRIGDAGSDSESCPMRSVRPPRVRRVRAEHGIKFFDDVFAGEEIDLGSYAFTADRIQAFHSRYQPSGFVPNSARTSSFGDEAHEWHVVSAWMQCIVRYYRRQAEHLGRCGRKIPLLGPAAGVKHLRWHAPVRACEAISYRTWAERKIEIATRDDWGLLIAGAEGVNAAGQTVVSFYPQMLLQRDKGAH